MATCSLHVASVLQMTHMLLCHGGLLKSNAFAGSLHLASYWSAVVHDFEHGGLNNDFLVKTAHPIALIYNDQSPLENHHLAAAFRIWIDPQCQYMTVGTHPLRHPGMARHHCCACVSMPTAIEQLPTCRGMCTYMFACFRWATVRAARHVNIQHKHKAACLLLPQEEVGAACLR